VRASDHLDPGAARPPLYLKLVQSVLGLCLLLLAFEAEAQQPEGCRYITSSPVHAEGFNGPDTFGVRLITRNNRWAWGGAHAGVIAGCPTCGAGTLAKGLLRIGLAPFYPPSDDYQLRRETEQQSASPVEFALHPRTIGVGLWSITNFTPRGVLPETDITPVTLFGMPAMARVVTINSSGNPIHGLAIAMQEGCFSLFGIFFRDDNGPLSIGDVQQIDDALKLEKYTPRFNLEQLTPRPPPAPWVQFPLGNARKQWEEERRRQQKE
jgi:hypothetical protein